MELDITFDLISNTFKPYTKLGNTPQSVNRVDKPVKHLTQYIIVWLRSATIPRKARDEQQQLSYILTHSLNGKEIQEEMSLGTTHTTTPR